MSGTAQFGTYYAIRNRETQQLLPLRSDNRHSHAEFGDCGPPRLFITKGGAATALRNWSKGVWRTTAEWESTDEYGSGFYVQGLPAPPDKAPEGRAVNCDVVPVTLYMIDLKV